MRSREMRPWSYVFQEDGNRIFHITDMGLYPHTENHNIAVATLEYARQKNVLSFSKSGIKKPWDDEQSGNNIKSGATFDYRILPTVNLKNESNIVTPIQFLQCILLGEIKGNHEVPVAALKYFLDSLELDREEQKFIGIEGSLCIGQANEGSDLDLLIYGFDNYFKIIKALPNLFKTDPNIIPLKGFVYGKNELIERRKDHSPFSEQELLLVTERRPYFYIKQTMPHNGRVIYTKISLFGVIDTNDGEYRKKLDVFLNPVQVKKVEIATISGRVSDSTLGLTIPSVWQIDCKYKGIEVDYIADYAGIFSGHLEAGEKFEARGTIEKYRDWNGKIGYRLVIAYWDQHVKNNMYVKPILN